MLTLLALRYGGAVLLFWGLVWLTRQRLPTDPMAALRVLGLGAALLSLQAALFYSSLERLDAGLTVLLLYTFPAMVAVGSVAIGREPPSRRKAAAVLVATHRHRPGPARRRPASRRRPRRRARPRLGARRRRLGARQRPRPPGDVVAGRLGAGLDRRGAHPLGRRPGNRRRRRQLRRRRLGRRRRHHRHLDGARDLDLDGRPRPRRPDRHQRPHDRRGAARRDLGHPPARRAAPDRPGDRRRADRGRRPAAPGPPAPPPRLGDRPLRQRQSRGEDGTRAP